MTTSALITMFSWMGIVTIIAVYFFWKVLIAKKKKEPDSCSENDDVTEVRL